MMTNERIREILIDFIETSTTALDVLKDAGYTGDRQRAVAEVLESCTIRQPPDFPCSSACIAYGKTIAEHILAQEEQAKLNELQKLTGSDCDPALSGFALQTYDRRLGNLKRTIRELRDAVLKDLSHRKFVENDATVAGSVAMSLDDILRQLEQVHFSKAKSEDD